MVNSLPEGIIIPLIIPFKADGEVDFEILKVLTNFYINSGVHALFVLGSAGQGPVMTQVQRQAALEVIMKEADSRIPIIAHVGTADSQSGRDLARHAAECGVKAIAIVPPYYYSDHTKYEVQRHFCEIAEGAPHLPVIVYDNPKYTGIPMTPPVVADLYKELPTVAGIKPSFSGLEQMLGYMKAIPGIKVYTASIEYITSGVPLGLAGAINPPTSFFPEACLEVWQATIEKRYEDAFRLQKGVNEIKATVAKFMNRYGRGTFAEILLMRGIHWLMSEQDNF
jgi:dihydrodipicolinate synthase/N-acetylneuraminate lyase